MKLFSFHSFRQRLNAAFLAVSLVPMLICSALLLQIFRLRLQTDASETAQTQLDSISQSFDALHEGFQEVLDSLQTNSLVTKALFDGTAEDSEVYTQLFSATESVRSFARFDLYDISGRCGVYAKTDIQPLLNQGVAKADIALSSFHAIATGKYIGDCRLTHYSALLRKALDDAGFSDVPILTNDDTDFHNLHPGFRLSLPSALRIAYALPMIDILEELLRKIRPYELTKGSADAAFDQALDAVIDGLAAHGVAGAKHGFSKAIEIMKQVPYDRSHPRPTVLIIGEYLLNFHPGANHDIEAFLEQNVSSSSKPACPMSSRSPTSTGICRSWSII